MHGHRYVVEAVLEADELDKNGFVADFDTVEPLLDKLAARLDHRLLNELIPFKEEGPPSAERQAEYFFRELDSALKASAIDVRLVKIRITQDPDTWAEYEP